MLQFASVLLDSQFLRFLYAVKMTKSERKEIEIERTCVFLPSQLHEEL